MADSLLRQVSRKDAKTQREQKMQSDGVDYTTIHEVSEGRRFSA
jgi:hypothetical protein